MSILTKIYICGKMVKNSRRSFMNIYLKDFLNYAQNEDMTLPVLMAVNRLSDGDTLCLGGGELHFYPEYAFKKEYFISNNDYSLKPIAFPLIGKKNITVDGEGAKLVFHGKISPFVVDGCEDITLKGFEIDYAEPMYFEAKITCAEENFVEMEFDESQFHCEILGDKFRFYGEGWENVTPRVLVNEFDPAYKGPTHSTPTYFACITDQKNMTFMSGLYRYLKASQPKPNVIRLEGEILHKHQVGKYWLCTHTDRKHPGIFVTESKNINLANIKLTHTISMGVICQLTENITLDGVSALPGEGRMLSVAADATHFVNCFGLIHCRFESMMDDVGNFHGIYMPVKKKLDENRVMLYFGHPQQAGINIFRKGDKIRIADNESLIQYADFTVKSSTLVSDKYVILETEEKLPETLPEGHVFENYTRMPEVHIENCRCGYNRPRGWLISTCKRAVIENCTFYNLSYAIDMAGDANSWYESGPCTEVIIRNNNFDNAAYHGGPVIMGDPQIRKHTGKPYHSGIVIEDNTFRLHERRILDLLSFGNVVFKNNKFVQDDSLPSHKITGEDGYRFRECENLDIEKV